MSALAYLWTDPDMDGIQFCATHGSGEIVTVHDLHTYAELAYADRDRVRIEHYATAELARRAGEDHLWRKGITP